MPDQNIGDAKTTDVKGAFPLIDRAMEFKFALLAMSLILFADVTAVVFRKKNLLTLDWRIVGGDLSPGLLLIFAGAYLLYMSGIMAAIAVIAVATWGRIGNYIGGVIDSLKRKEPTYRLTRSTGNRPSDIDVSEFDLRLEALNERDSFLLGLVDRAAATRKATNDAVVTNGQASLACLILVVAEWALSGTILAPCFDGTIYRALTVPIILLIGAPFVHFLAHDPYRRIYVPYPPLARRLLAKWMAARAEEDKFLDEVEARVQADHARRNNSV